LVAQQAARSSGCLNSIARGCSVARFYLLFSSYGRQLSPQNFLAKRTKSNREKYRRFATAAEAIRYAVETLRTPKAFGAWLQIGDERFNSSESNDCTKPLITHCASLSDRAPRASSQRDRWTHNRRVTLPPPESPSAGTIHQEVLQNEPAFATMKWSAAFAASKLLVGQSLIRFDAHQFVLRAVVRASERRCFGNWHGVGEGSTLTIYFTDGRSANVGRPIVDR
jgi:hypothetical protein